MVLKINSEGTLSLPTSLGEKQKKELNDHIYNVGVLRKRADEE